MKVVLRYFLVGILLVFLAGPDAMAGRGGGGGGRGGGGGARGGGGYSRSGGGSFSRSGGGGYSRGGGNYSRSGGGNYSRSTTSRNIDRTSLERSNRNYSNVNRSGGGRVPSKNTAARTKPSGQRIANSSAQLPSSSRTDRGGTNRATDRGGTNRATDKRVSQRPSNQPARPGASRGQVANRPTNRDVSNFLNLDTKAGGGRLSESNLVQRPSQLPANAQRQGLNERLGGGNREQRFAAGQNRDNWSQWSQNRSNNWQQAVQNREGFWNNWSGQNQDRLNNFRQNQDQRWNNLQTARDDRQAWRETNREDWQNYRNDTWDYRYDRADQIWDDVKDYHDDLFDDHWWGAYPGYVGGYVSNPWWWWAPATVGVVSGFVSGVTASEPYYYDYGVTTVYQGDTVYVDGKPAGSPQEHAEKAIALADKVESAPPPSPPASTKEETSQKTGSKDEAAAKESNADWLAMGVWALTQEEKGDAVVFMQISVNKQGVISGAFKNTVTGETGPIIGAIDPESQLAAWRLGQDGKAVIETGIFNLTRDVASVALHFDSKNTKNWLLVRLPQPEMPDQPTKVEAIDREPPPLTPAKKDES
jgi:hypothetical protein